jgi:hypothetical protein
MAILWKPGIRQGRFFLLREGERIEFYNAARENGGNNEESQVNYTPSGDGPSIRAACHGTSALAAKLH